MNIACPFEAIREASVRVTRECFSVAAEIGASVVIHLGISPGNRKHDLAHRQFKKSLHELEDAAETSRLLFISKIWVI